MGGADKTTKGKDHASLMLNEAILAETVRKEQRVYKLYENYTFSPKALKNIVYSVKPNSKPAKGEEEKLDQDYLKWVETQNSLKPNSLLPKTVAQEYGWDADMAYRNTDRRFYFPKNNSEITKVYGAVAQDAKK